MLKSKKKISRYWGDEYVNYPNSHQTMIANYLSKLGVNLVIGHHPHVVQPITYINDTLVASITADNNINQYGNSSNGFGNKNPGMRR